MQAVDINMVNAVLPVMLINSDTISKYRIMTGNILSKLGRQHLASQICAERSLKRLEAVCIPDIDTMTSWHLSCGSVNTSCYFFLIHYLYASAPIHEIAACAPCIKGDAADTTEHYSDASKCSGSRQSSVP